EELAVILPVAGLAGAKRLELPGPHVGDEVGLLVSGQVHIAWKQAAHQADGNRGKTPGIADFRASPDAGEYDSLVACHHLLIRPVYNAPSLRLGSWSCWASWLN